ncbi:Ger(x)C family spore germination protein [Sutcliffiella horikoshii]|uniref:Ger(x)C family spore germination protein n=1 Tax=Sutcliffiella horikoshii TaxID=79883 RepID=UPI0007D09D24|nr:Ger(x)C family spore germination protein [Sutcliffiella horikoshii]MCM3617245.1 Ger(x)C family spore germination protein [Sutcliffiella horikoshii]
MKYIVWSLMIILLCGCASQKQLEELGLITAIGYDRVDDKLMGSIVYYEFDPLHPNNTKMVTSVANTSKEIRHKENLSSSRKLVSGQLRAAVYGRELAEEGIISVIDTLSRDAEVGTMVYLAVSNIPAHDLLTRAQESSDVTNAGTYLYNLIEQNVEEDSLISPTLHEFMQCLYSEGRDPILPLLNFIDNTIVIEGMALFKEDKVIGEIDTKSAFYLKLLLGPYDAGSVEIEIPLDQVEKHILSKNNKVEEEVYISLDHIRSKTQIKLVDKKMPSFKINAKVVTRMQEITVDYDLGNPEALKKIEEQISIMMEKKLKEVILASREIGSDPVGFGNIYRSKVGYDSFSKKEWRELYQQADFDIDIKVEILRTGVMD